MLANVGVKVVASDSSTHWTLQNINVAYHAGERVGLLGRNGSGKTTLVRLMGSLDRPTKGKISIRPNRARIVLVLQRPEEHFVRGTVGEQINSYAPRSLNPDTIHDLMTKVGLPPELGKWPPLRLSTGQQRLVAIACALATGTSIVILDEPMAGLDSSARRLVKQALAQLYNVRELGWIIVSHHPDDLLGLVERVWILDNGKLLYDGPFQHVPLSALSACLSTDDTSIYRWMCEIESRGAVLPDEIYSTSEPKEISRILLGVQIP
jgi:ABC-type multidrug transport system ATPase subunit